MAHQQQRVSPLTATAPGADVYLDRPNPDRTVASTNGIIARFGHGIPIA
jgi:hypothetical protein